MPPEISKNILATTMKYHARELADDVTTHIPLLKMMLDKASLKVRGGSKLVFPLEVGDNTSTLAYEGYQTLTITDDDILDYAEVRWARYNTSYQYSDDDEAFNDGEEQVIDFISTRIKNTKNSLKKILSSHLFGDGSAMDNKALYGIPYYVRADTTSTADVAGIDQGTKTWWRNQAVNNAGGSYGAWGSATNKYGRSAISDLFIDLTRNEDYPGLGIMHKDVFKKLKKEYAQAELYQLGSNQNEKKKYYGSRSFVVDDVEMAFDANCPANTFYALNMDYMKFYIHKKKNFQWIPAMRPTNQASQVGHIRVYLQLVCTNRSLQGVIYGIS